MAVDHDTRAPSRRAVLAAGVIAGLAPAVARATADPDAALVALARQWRAAQTTLDGQCAALAAAEAGMTWQDMQRAERPMLATQRRIDGIEAAIAATSASGATGLAVKAALLARIHLGATGPQDRHDGLARTLAADARRLVPCAAGVEA